MEIAPWTVTTAAPKPPGGDAYWFKGKGDARLRAGLFTPPRSPRGTVVLSSGHSEPIEKYFEVIDELLDRGFVVLAHDWRGQGLSQRLLPDRMKGHAIGFSDFVTDYTALLDTFSGGQMILFEAAAYDMDDGPLGGNVQWFSSLDGSLAPRARDGLSN